MPWQRAAPRRAEHAAWRDSLGAEIEAVFLESKKRYGAPRIHAELRMRGFRVSKRTVAKFMQEKGLRPPRGWRCVPITTDSRHVHAIAPNLLEQKFDVALPNTVWLADILYIPTDEGWLYLAAVKDLATMESFFGSLKTEFVHRTRFTTRREARAALFEYIEIFYNRQLRHSSIGYRTPAQARMDFTVAKAA